MTRKMAPIPHQAWTQIARGRRRREPFSRGRRCFSWRVPSTWNATCPARRGRVWQPACTWQKLRWKSGSKTEGINGRDSWRQSWKLPTWLMLPRDSSEYPYCTTRQQEVWYTTRTTYQPRRRVPTAMVRCTRVCTTTTHRVVCHPVR